MEKAENTNGATPSFIGEIFTKNVPDLCENIRFYGWLAVRFSETGFSRKNREDYLFLFFRPEK